MNKRNVHVALFAIAAASSFAVACTSLDANVAPGTRSDGLLAVTTATAVPVPPSNDAGGVGDAGGVNTSVCGALQGNAAAITRTWGDVQPVRIVQVKEECTNEFDADGVTRMHRVTCDYQAIKERPPTNETGCRADQRASGVAARETTFTFATHEVSLGFCSPDTALVTCSEPNVALTEWKQRINDGQVPTFKDPIDKETAQGVCCNTEAFWGSCTATPASETASTHWTVSSNSCESGSSPHIRLSYGVPHCICTPGAAEDSVQGPSLGVIKTRTAAIDKCIDAAQGEHALKIKNSEDTCSRAAEGGEICLKGTRESVKCNSKIEREYLLAQAACWTEVDSKKARLTCEAKAYEVQDACIQARAVTLANQCLPHVWRERCRVAYDDALAACPSSANRKWNDEKNRAPGEPAPPDVKANAGGFSLENPAMPSGFSTFSRLTSLQLTFDTPVTIEEGAFALKSDPFSITNDASASRIVTPRTSSLSSLGAGVIELTFVGTQGVEFRSLHTGIWTLSIDMTKVHNGAVRGTGVVTVGNIRRLFGDVNGNGLVDGGDFGQFGSAFGLNREDPSFNEQFDANDDGNINGGDFGPFGSRFGTGL